MGKLEKSENKGWPKLTVRRVLGGEYDSHDNTTLYVLREWAPDVVTGKSGVKRLLGIPL